MFFATLHSYKKRDALRADKCEMFSNFTLIENNYKKLHQAANSALSDWDLTRTTVPCRLLDRPAMPIVTLSKL